MFFSIFIMLSTLSLGFTFYSKTLKTIYPILRYKHQNLLWMKSKSYQLSNMASQSNSMKLDSKNNSFYLGLVIERQNDKLLVEYNTNNTTESIVCLQRLSSSSSSTITNLVVGDKVLFTIDSTTTPPVGIVTKAEKRLNVLERPAPSSAGRAKLVMKSVASNIDQLIIVTAPKPSVPLYTIDQFIVGAIAMNIPNIIIAINKADLMETKEMYQQYQMYYSSSKHLGYPIVQTSTTSDSIGIRDLEPYLSNKTSILVGQSGVGKSSLVNRIIPQASARVGSLVSKLEIGAHTTSNARLYHIGGDGSIIDSPGIREFGLWHFHEDMITQGFVEIDWYSKECKFSDCIHSDKIKGCAVTAAVVRGEIHPLRLRNYRKIMESVMSNGK